MHIESLKTLIQVLDVEVAEDVKSQVRVLRDDQLFQLHFGLNALIRHLAYYANESAIGKQHFAELGFPDERSAVLGKIYWHHLRRETLSQAAVLSAIEENTIFVFGEPAQSLAERFAKSYSELATR